MAGLKFGNGAAFKQLCASDGQLEEAAYRSRGILRVTRRHMPEPADWPDSKEPEEPAGPADPADPADPAEPADPEPVPLSVSNDGAQAGTTGILTDAEGKPLTILRTVEEYDENAKQKVEFTEESVIIGTLHRPHALQQLVDHDKAAGHREYVNDLKVSIVLAKEEQHIAYFDIDFYAQFEDGAKAEWNQHSAIRMTKEQINDTLTVGNDFTKPDNDDEDASGLLGEEAFASLADKFGVEQQEVTSIHSKGCLVYVAFEFHCYSFIGDAFLSNLQYGPYEPRMQVLKQWILAGGKLKFEFLADDGNLAEELHKLEDSMQATEKTAEKNKTKSWPRICENYTDNVMNPQQGQLQLSDPSTIYSTTKPLPTPIRARASYIDSVELFGALSMKNNIELMEQKNVPTGFVPYQARFAVMVGNTRAYWMFLAPKDARDASAVRLKPGETVQVSMGSTSCENEETWRGVVEETPGFAVPGDTCIVLFQRYVVPNGQSRRDGYWDNTDIPAAAILPVNEQREPIAVQNALRDMPPVIVNIKKPVDVKTHQLQVTGVNKAWLGRQVGYMRNVIHCIQGHKPLELRQYDIYQRHKTHHGLHYENIAEQFRQIVNDAGLAKQQGMALQMLVLPQPGVVRLIHGPAGTGKTYILHQGVKFHMTLGRENPDWRVKILWVAPSNDLVDAAALKLSELASTIPVGAGRPYCIVRQHTKVTEKAVAKLSATNKLGENATRADDARRYDFTDDELATVADLAVAKDLTQRFQDSTRRTVSSIPDRRLKHQALSLGELTANVVGLNRGADIPPNAPSTHPSAPSPEPDAFRRLRVADAQFANRELENTEAYTTALNDCMKIVLRDCVDILVTTVTNATTNFTTDFGADLIIADEASRIDDCQTLSMLAHNKVPAMVLAGDQYQLPPPTHFRRASFKLSPMTTPSTLQRLAVCGAPQANLTVEQRFSMQITRLANTLCYGSLKAVVSKEGFAEQTRVSRVLHNFGLPPNRTVAQFKVDDGRAHRVDNATGSTYNTRFVEAAFSVMLTFLEAKFTPSQIAVVTPYNAQKALYKAMLPKFASICLQRNVIDSDTAAAISATKSTIQIETVDSFQGLECSVLIFDVVVTEKLGFVAEAARPITAITRAKNGLVIIGNHESLDSAHDEPRTKRIWERTALSKMFAFCRQENCLATPALSLPSMRQALESRNSSTRSNTQEPLQLQRPEREFADVEGHAGPTDYDPLAPSTAHIPAPRAAKAVDTTVDTAADAAAHDVGAPAETTTQTDDELYSGRSPQTHPADPAIDAAAEVDLSLLDGQSNLQSTVSASSPVHNSNESSTGPTSVVDTNTSPASTDTRDLTMMSGALTPATAHEPNVKVNEPNVPVAPVTPAPALPALAPIPRVKLPRLSRPRAPPTANPAPVAPVPVPAPAPAPAPASQVETQVMRTTDAQVPDVNAASQSPDVASSASAAAPKPDEGKGRKVFSSRRLGGTKKLYDIVKKERDVKAYNQEYAEPHAKADALNAATMNGADEHTPETLATFEDQQHSNNDNATGTLATPEGQQHSSNDNAPDTWASSNGDW